MDEAQQTSLSDAKESFRHLAWALLVLLFVTNITYNLLFGFIDFMASAVTSDIADEAAFYETPVFMTYPWFTNTLHLVCQLIGTYAVIRVLRAVPAAAGEQKPLDWKEFFVFFLCCFPIAYVGDLIGTALASFLSGGTAVNPLESTIDYHPLSIVYVLLLGPLLEEIIFRKQLIDRSVKYGEENAILFSALCFGLYHQNLYQFFYTFGSGVIFSYVYVRTRKLHYTVLMHILFNLTGTIFSFVSSDMAGIVFVVVLSVAGVAALILKVRHLTFQRTEEQIQKGEIFRTVYINWCFILFFALMILSTILRLFFVTA